MTDPTTTLPKIAEDAPQSAPARSRFALPKAVLNLAALAMALLAIFLFFSWQLPRTFPTLRNVEMLARQSAIVAMGSLGMTYVIVGGAIDLSVGSILAFVSVAIAALLRSGYDPWVAALAGVFAGALWGAANGLLVTRLRVSPFIVTLGTLLVVRGAAKGIAGEQKIDAPSTWLSGLLAVLNRQERWKLLPPGVWLTLALAIAMALALRYTRFGRHVVAVGSNEQAARLCGVAVERVRLWIFVASGAFAGLAGLLMFSRLSVGDPTVAQGYELDAIAAVVIGGASLAGGEGGIAGTLLGALIMATVRSGFSQMGLPNWVQEIVTGAIIVAAVALDRLRARRQS